MVTTLRLKPIGQEDLERASVLEVDEPNVPAMKGERDGDDGYTFVCHSCDSPVIKHIRKNQVRGLVTQCNFCGEYNYLP